MLFSVSKSFRDVGKFKKAVAERDVPKRGTDLLNGETLLAAQPRTVHEANGERHDSLRDSADLSNAAE